MSKCNCFECKLDRSTGPGKVKVASTQASISPAYHADQSYQPYASVLSSLVVGLGLGILTQRLVKDWTPSTTLFSQAYANWIQDNSFILTLPIDTWSPTLFQQGLSSVAVLLTVADGVATITVPGVYRISYSTTLAILEPTQNALTIEADDTALLSLGIFKNEELSPLSTVSDTVKLKTDIGYSVSFSDEHFVTLGLGDRVTVLGTSESKEHHQNTKSVQVRVEVFNFNLQLIQPSLEFPALASLLK